MSLYIAYIEGTEQGPYPIEDLEMMESIGEITGETQVRLENHDVWKQWSRVKQERADDAARFESYQAVLHPEAVLKRRMAGIPAPAAPMANYSMQGETSPRSRVSFILLGLFFGCLGVHNFYAGYKGRGLAQLAISLLGLLIFIGPAVVALWALIEVIVIREDAEGRPFAA